MIGGALIGRGLIVGWRTTSGCLNQKTTLFFPPICPMWLEITSYKNEAALFPGAHLSKSSGKYEMGVQEKTNKKQIKIMTFTCLTISFNQIQHKSFRMNGRIVLHTFQTSRPRKNPWAISSAGDQPPPHLKTSSCRVVASWICNWENRDAKIYSAAVTKRHR